MRPRFDCRTDNGVHAGAGGGDCRAQLYITSVACTVYLDFEWHRSPLLSSWLASLALTADSDIPPRCTDRTAGALPRCGNRDNAHEMTSSSAQDARRA